MKKWFPLYLVLWLVLTCVGGISFVDATVVQINRVENFDEYCKDSAICGSPSKEFSLMMDFVREMMNSIKTIGTEWPYLGKYVNPNRFEGNRFVSPEKSIVSRITRNLVQKTTFGVAAIAIFANPVNVFGGKDVMGNVVLVSKNRVFLRDTKLLEEIESQLSTKKLEIGLWWAWFDKVNSHNVAVMHGIVQKYVELGLLDGGTSYLVDWVSYVNIVSILTQILSSAKTFLYVDSIGQFDSVSRWWENGIRISFVQGVGQKMQNDYTCARGLWDVCDVSLKEKFAGLWQNLTDMFFDASTGDQWFKTTFKDANNRFVSTFSPSKAIDPKRFQARRHDLLQSTHGRSERGTFIEVNYDDGGDGQEALDVAKWWIVNVRKYMTNKDFRTKKQDEKKAQQQVALEEVRVVSVYDEAEATFQNILQAYVNDVFVQQSLDIELATFSEVKDVTPWFAKLWQQIYAIKDVVLGGTNKEWSLIKTLRDAAVMQCSQ